MKASSDLKTGRYEMTDTGKRSVRFLSRQAFLGEFDVLNDGKPVTGIASESDWFSLFDVLFYSGSTTLDWEDVDCLAFEQALGKCDGADALIDVTLTQTYRFTNYGMVPVVQLFYGAVAEFETNVSGVPVRIRKADPDIQCEPEFPEPEAPQDPEEAVSTGDSTADGEVIPEADAGDDLLESFLRAGRD